VGENSHTARPFRSGGEKQLSGVKDGDNRHDSAPEQQHDEEDKQRRSKIFQARIPEVAGYAWDERKLSAGYSAHPTVSGI
jgi:hypothetical protein